MQTSNISNGSSALQALQMLMASLQTSATNALTGAASTGQSVPGGSSSTSTQTVAPSLLSSTPSGQFADAALSFLTSLQDPRSAAAAAAQSTASLALGGFSSALNSLS